MIMATILALDALLLEPGTLAALRRESTGVVRVHPAASWRVMCESARTPREGEPRRLCDALGRCRRSANPVDGSRRTGSGEQPSGFAARSRRGSWSLPRREPFGTTRETRCG